MTKRNGAVIRIVADQPRWNHAKIYALEGDKRIDITEMITDFSISVDSKGVICAKLEFANIELNIAAEKVIDKLFFDSLVASIQDANDES